MNMKASETIVRLKQLIEENGDLDIFTEDEDNITHSAHFGIDYLVGESNNEFWDKTFREETKGRKVIRII